VATVRPYSELTGVSIEIEAGLTMPPGSGTARELSRAAQIIDDGKPTVICAHGENLPSLLQAACARLGARPPKGPPLRKAAWWVLHTADGTLAGAERYHPADT
jgi:8-oxo-(d)GTP phosphatase